MKAIDSVTTCDYKKKFTEGFDWCTLSDNPCWDCEEYPCEEKYELEGDKNELQSM